MADKFEEDKPTFRTEKSRMRHFMSMLEGDAEMAIAPRYQSVERPFSCLAEMIQVLAAAYHDPNQASHARRELINLEYEPGKVDIHAFIARFNAIAMKAQVPENRWKENLWDHIPPDLDSRLLHDTTDDDVSYELFCDRVAKAAYSNERAYQRRQKKKSKGTVFPKKEQDKVRGPNRRMLNPLSDADRKKHLDKGTCFNCGEQGHIAAKCPKKQGAKRVSVVIAEKSSSSSEESEKE